MKISSKIALILIIAALAYSQYRATSWKQEQQLLAMDEVHSWRIVLRRYGVNEAYLMNRRYSAADILRENGLSPATPKYTDQYRFTAPEPLLCKPAPLPVERD